jgi:hypothetical protein
MRTFTRCTPNHPRPTFWRVALHILLGACLGLALAGVFGAALMWIWNYVMPGLFHLPAVSFGQAVALLVLARLLFGRIGHGRHRRHWFGGHGARHCGAPSQERYERWWRGRNDPPASDPQA